MTDANELAQIVDSLATKTREGGLTWGKDENTGEDEFYAATGRFGYYVGSRDNDGEPPYRLEVWRVHDDESIKLLDAVTVNEYSGAQGSVKALVEAARQSMAGLRRSLAEEVLLDLMGDDTPF